MIPQNDKSLLIINSGMAPLKPYFAGVETPPSKRMTTCQKCIRTGDIDNVGKTARHGTFFEMLGNFSFGDYFKEQSLTWGWEFITEWLKMPKDRVWATVYQDDDEAHDIWVKLACRKITLSAWAKTTTSGKSVWVRAVLAPKSSLTEARSTAAANRIANRAATVTVILNSGTTYSPVSKEEDGSYSDLAHKNIDTGMGLERMACIMQGVDSIFDIDTIRHILNAVAEKAGVKYEQGSEQNDISLRIVTDHLRSMVFMISDGILPSNEGRGYVLRRLIRRAARNGMILGINQDDFLAELADKVIEVSGGAYPELVEKQEYIKKIIRNEESQFSKTLANGLSILNDYMSDMDAKGEKVLSGELAFKLYDTYGFPIELTEEILAENGKTPDMEGFRQSMANQKETARAGQRDTSDEAWKDAVRTPIFRQRNFWLYRDRSRGRGSVLRFL